MNILGPEIGEEEGKKQKQNRRGFGRLISQVLALAMAHELLYEEPVRLPVVM